MFKSLVDLKENEILSKAVTLWDGRVILPEGVALRPEYIQMLKELGVRKVYVRDPEVEEDEGIVILKTEIERSAKEKVKDVLERHTYHNNKELEELSKTADNIIENILEEEQIVEKVFDIKERSADIYEHSISICSMSILTAIKMGLDKKKAHDIGVACLLHDIGLRYMTIDVINRDEKDFNPQELAEYKKHPIYGYTSVQNEKWISETSKNIILSHHERINGSGFPLKARELPIECKIVNVCDAFDEMICGIGQKKAKVYEAIEYLKAFKNIKFDDKIVDVFLGFIAVYPVGTRVITNEGETAVVTAQNKDFPSRPVIRIIKDKNGRNVREGNVRDLVKVQNIYIEKVVD